MQPCPMGIGVGGAPPLAWLCRCARRSVPMSVDLKSLEADMTAWRRHIHQHPELGFHEQDTVRFILDLPESFGDRKSVVWGKSVSVRVDLGGLRLIKKTK